MIGSILGDIAGSIYEFRNIKTKEFPFLTPQKGYTDDSILTLATADWLLHGGDCATYYFRYATRYPCPLGGFGGRFREWLRQGQQTGQLRPYGSCGNGSAMRVGPVGWAFRTEEETLEAARISAACTHNHPEGIKGARNQGCPGYGTLHLSGPEREEQGGYKKYRRSKIRLRPELHLRRYS